MEVIAPSSFSLGPTTSLTVSPPCGSMLRTSLPLIRSTDSQRQLTAHTLRASPGVTMRTAAVAVVGVARQSTTLGRAASVVLHGCCNGWQGQRRLPLHAYVKGCAARVLQEAARAPVGSSSCQVTNVRVVRAEMGIEVWGTPEGSPASRVFPYVPPPPIVRWLGAAMLGHGCAAQSTQPAPRNVGRPWVTLERDV